MADQPRKSGVIKQRGKIQALLERHRTRYTHNKVPFEKAVYLQMVHNPLIRNQFISVQQVTRLKQLDLGYTDGGPGPDGDGVHGDKAEKQKAMSFGIEALLGNQLGASREMILGDRGKGVYKYEYETCKTSGPTSGPGFTDPDKKV